MNTTLNFFSANQHTHWAVRLFAVFALLLAPVQVAAFNGDDSSANPIETLVLSEDFQKLAFDQRLAALEEKFQSLPEPISDEVWARGVAERVRLLAAMGEFEKGIEYLETNEQKLLNILPYTDFYSQALYPIGYVYVYNNRMEKTLEVIGNLKKEYAKTGNIKTSQDGDTLLVALHSLIGNNIQAAEILIENHEDDSFNDLAKVDQLKLIVNIIFALISGEQFDEARKYIEIGFSEYDKAVLKNEISELEAKQLRWHFILNDSFLDIKRKNYSNLSDTVDEINRLADEVGAPLYEVFSDYIIAADHFGQGNTDLALEVLEQASVNAEMLGENDLLVDIYEAKAEFAHSKGDYETAFNEHIKAEKIVNSINAQQFRARADYVAAKIAFEERNARIHILEEERRLAIRAAQRNKMILFGLIIGLGCLLLLLYHLFRSKRHLKTYSEELEISETKAMTAMQAKSAFLANMSHEIRTPLNGLLGMAHILNDKALDEEAQKCVNVIVDAGESLLTIVNDVLDLSKIEAGKMSVELAPTDIQKILKKTHQLWESKAREKGIDLKLNIEPSLNTFVDCDGLRLRQCLSNLISNAIKFTDKGVVTIHADLENAERDDTEGDNIDGDARLKISVTDTGIGMTQGAISRLFQAFEQVDQSTTRKSGGTGLGLTITNEFVHLMNGNVDVESTVGIGSTFTIDIGVKRSSHSAIASTTSSKTEHTKLEPIDQSLRVLLVDDNAVNRLVARAFLAETKLEVIEAANGQEALAHLNADANFDIVLLDIHMPVMDGPETIRQIRASEQPWSNVPIITLTADAMIGDKDKYLAMGTEGYIAKPIAKSELLQEVTRVLAKYSSSRSAAA